MLLVDNFIHGDLHCKNWKVRIHNEKPQIIVYDCGICFENVDVNLSSDVWFAIGKYDIPNLITILKKFVIVNNLKISDCDYDMEIKNIFDEILKNSLGTGMLLKSIIHFFNKNDIIINKFLLNFCILICLVEEFLKSNDVINRERNIAIKGNMFNIIIDNQLDLIAFCKIKNCFPQVHTILKNEIEQKKALCKNIHILENNSLLQNEITATKPNLFNSINLSGLAFKPPE